MISLRKIIASFRAIEAHDFSSVQCDFPEDISQEIIDWGKKNIPDSELAEDGREDHIHVTVKYGLHGHDPFELRSLIFKHGPIDVKLGEISLFQNDEADVVKIEVESPGLVALNKKIADSFEHTDTHPDYIPHVTVAYLKPGMGQKYVGPVPFTGKKIRLTSVMFSGNDNRETTLPL